MSSWYNNPPTTDTVGFWTATGVAAGIDLREEFNKLVLGHGTYPGIGQFMIHRILDRDGVRCPCWDNTRGSSVNCKYCKGESYSWSETWVRGYFTQTYGRGLVAATEALQLRPEGIFDMDKALIYLPYTTDPKTGDALFRIKLNIDGKPYYPIERVEKWRAVNVEDRRQEKAELAFWLVLAERVEF